MSLRITATSATEIAAGIWTFEMPPHQIRHFGVASLTVGARSVLMLDSYEYDAIEKHLHFEIDAVTPLNGGTTNTTIAIASTLESSASTSPTENAFAGHAFGPGDRTFLRMARAELTDRTAEIAEKLLAAVRIRSPGDLKKGKSRNFSETPDNFWYVIIQPRVDELSITVRGSVDHFQRISGLEIKDDRGNTRFKVRDSQDISEALKLIFHAHRKP